MEKLKRSILLLCFMGFWLTTKAQEGNVQVFIPADLKFEIESRVSQTDSTNIRGYRIQVYFGSNRENAQKAVEKIVKEYPELKDVVYTVYQSPNYKVRVGDYYREIDAQHLLKELEALFSNAFVVKDKINYPKLNIKKEEEED